MSFLEVSNLEISFGENVILSNVNLAMEKGKVYGLYGRNGSGKSILFKAIAGLLKYQNGTVSISGEDYYHAHKFYDKLGILIEIPQMISYLTGFENLQLLAKINNKVSDKEIIKYMEDFDLPNDKKIYKNYSMGMKQKIGIIQSFMEGQDLIILDEPTNGLDENSVIMFKKIIMSIKKDKCILISSHIKDDLYELSDEFYSVSNKGVEKVEL